MRNQRARSYLFVEGKKEEMAFTCDKCRRYLVTTDQSGNLRRTNADLIAISLAHFDMLVQEKGFRPMAECEWNTSRLPARRRAEAYLLFFLTGWPDHGRPIPARRFTGRAPIAKARS